MSTLSNIFRLLVNLIAPPRCGVCRELLSEGQHFVCTKCRLEMPMTNYHLRENNSMLYRVVALRPEIAHASALIYYSAGSRWSRLIHRFKYQGEWRSAVEMGRWLGGELSSSPYYEGVDLVMGIPLHPLRMMERGYNQSYYLAKGVAEVMGVECRMRGVRRRRYNRPQVRVSRSDRWLNVEHLFEVVDPSLFEGRHLLLVDDVFTTGATILSCAEAILDAVPSVTISIATVAASKYEFGVDVRG